MSQRPSTNTAHTPGPWHWDSDPVKGDPTGRVRYRVCTLGKTITQVYYSSVEGGATNAEADAKLIAAAPDLLAALEPFARFACDTRPCACHNCRARDAIAKAKGEA